MPCYTYKCVECGAVEERIRRIDERGNPVFCDCTANTKMALQIEAPAFKVRESMEDRLNTNYDKKMKRKETGEW